MRFFVEVTMIGKTDTQSYCVEASSWQPALEAARLLRLESKSLQGFSIELVDEGCRAVDPSARWRYVVRRAPDDAPLTKDPPSRPSSSMPPRHDKKTPPPRLVRQIPKPKSASLNGPNKATLEAGDKRASQKHRAIIYGEGGAIAVRADIPPEPQTLPTLPKSDPTLEDMPAIVVLPKYKQLFERTQEPTPSTPIRYREAVFAAELGLSEPDAEKILRAEFDRMRQEAGQNKPGIYINLALFDCEFEGKPPVLPIATLSFKDWKSTEADVGFPRRQRELAAAPTKISADLSHAAKRATTESKGQPNSAAKRADASPVPPAIAAIGAAIARASSAPPPPLNSRDTDITELENAPHEQNIPRAPAMPAGMAVKEEQEIASEPELPTPLLRPASVPPPAPAAHPTPLAPRPEPAHPLTASSARHKAVHAPPAQQPAAPLASAAPVPPAPPPAAIAAPPAAHSPHSPPVHLPGAPLAPAPPPPAPAVFPTAVQSPHPLPHLSPAPQLVLTPPAGMRTSGEDLLTSLFERVHDLHFLEDALQGGHFCLTLSQEQIPCRAAFIHYFDVNKREYVIACSNGAGAESLLARRHPESDPLLTSAAKMKGAVILNNAEQNEHAFTERFERVGGARRLVVAPIIHFGRVLGAMELINPLDGLPFTEDEGNAVGYIAGQLGEFIGSRGIVIDPARITAPRPPHARR